MAKRKFQGFVYQHYRRNRQAKQNLQKIINYSSLHPLSELINWLKTWQGPDQLLIGNTYFEVVLVIALVMLILFFILHLSFWFYVLLIALTIFAWLKKASSQQSVALAEALLQQRLAQQYNLQFAEHRLVFSLKQLVQMFPFFSLGNYSNSIDHVAATVVVVDNLIYPMTLFHYHYIEEVETTDKRGKRQQIFQHGHKYGVFVAGMPVKGVSISSHQKISARLQYLWTIELPSDESYQITANQDIQLSKQVKPKQLVTIRQLLAPYHGDFYIHPEHDLLCWIFDQNIFDQQPVAYPPNTVAELVNLLQRVTMPEYSRFRQHLIAILETFD